MRQFADSIALARRALNHLEDHTTDRAPNTMRQDIDAYRDPVRYAHEMEHIFKRLPLALALSIELAEPQTYRAMTVIGMPVLITRGMDGVARAFINACRHRGAPVCAPGSGKTKQFVCPYHTWVYDHTGALTAVYDEAKFGDLDKASLGLTELPCAEKSGFIWVALTPGARFDIDDWLGDFADELDTIELENWYLFEQRDLPGPGWKVCWDGYLEAYHHNSLHGRTVGKYTIGNLMLHDTYGPHQRIVFGRRSLRELNGVAEVDWQPDEHIRLIHSIFPDSSVSAVLNGSCLVSQVFPGPTLETTITRQSVLTAKKPETAEEITAAELFSATVLQAVVEEDYNIGFKIQAGLASGGNDAFLYGRNEPAVQHYHRQVAKFVAASD